MLPPGASCPLGTWGPVFQDVQGHFPKINYVSWLSPALPNSTSPHKFGNEGCLRILPDSQGSGDWQPWNPPESGQPESVLGGSLRQAHHACHGTDCGVLTSDTWAYHTPKGLTSGTECMSGFNRCYGVKRPGFRSWSPHLMTAQLKHLCSSFLGLQGEQASSGSKCTSNAHFQAPCAQLTSVRSGTAQEQLSHLFPRGVRPTSPL